jgi:hypothetical protein
MESRCPRHSFQRTCVDFSKTVEGANQRVTCFAAAVACELKKRECATARHSSLFDGDGNSIPVGCLRAAAGERCRCIEWSQANVI